MIDYGLGNINAFVNIYKQLNVPVKLANSSLDLIEASHIILPGVGAFDSAMHSLHDSGMMDDLNKAVVNDQKPILGVCVGMQMLGLSSEEGGARGLGWIDGVVKKIDKSNIPYMARLPHMGWNGVDPKNNEGLFSNLAEDAHFYFLHSYHFYPGNVFDILATTTYGESFVCAIKKGNIFGVQFHPEKSHASGIQLLKNFSEL